MTVPPISVDDLQNLIDRYGDNFDEWPADCRTQAEDLLSTSETARERLAEARLLRHQIEESAPKAPAGLADRIVAAALARDPGKR